MGTTLLQELEQAATELEDSRGTPLTGRGIQGIAVKGALAARLRKRIERIEELRAEWTARSKAGQERGTDALLAMSLLTGDLP